MQSKQIVPGHKYTANGASSYGFSKETGFYVKSPIFKSYQLNEIIKNKCSPSETLSDQTVWGSRRMLEEAGLWES